MIKKVYLYTLTCENDMRKKIMWFTPMTNHEYIEPFHASHPNLHHYLLYIYVKRSVYNALSRVTHIRRELFHVPEASLNIHPVYKRRRLFLDRSIIRVISYKVNDKCRFRLTLRVSRILSDVGTRVDVPWCRPWYIDDISRYISRYSKVRWYNYA